MAVLPNNHPKSRYREDSGWIVPTLLNSWVNYQPGTWAVAAYRRIDQVIWLKGLVTGGNTSIAFTLPEGFRPFEGSRMLTSISNAGVMRLDVNMGGDVTLFANAAGGFPGSFVSISVSFAM